MFHVKNIIILGCYTVQYARNLNSESLGFWTLSIVRNSKYKKTHRFIDWICFRPQVMGETPTLLGPLERANLYHRIRVSSPPPPQSPENGNRSSFRKRCVFLHLEFRTMENVYKCSNSECYTPSSQSFRFYYKFNDFQMNTPSSQSFRFYYKFNGFQMNTPSSQSFRVYYKFNDFQINTPSSQSFRFYYKFNHFQMNTPFSQSFRFY
jgi:hypothetical protein